VSISAQELVADLSRTIDETLAPLVPPGARVALLDFPNHNNVGDNAIWLGELAWLRRREVELVYVCDLSSYCSRTLRERIGGGVILLHGGGSFGTIWPRHQAFRERIVGEFQGHRIVQLPQTVDFSDRESLQRTRKSMGGNPDLVVLARDHQSVACLSDELGIESRLCPDMAFALGPFDRLRPSKDVLWLARSDHESLGPPAADPGEGIEVVDWLRGEPGRPWSYLLAPLTVRTRLAVNAAMQRWAWLRRWTSPYMAATFERLAWRRFLRGRRILSRGRVVITDRLHGHILSLLLGIPHVLLDNRFGKLERFHQTFTRGCRLARPAEDPAAALRIARQLLEEVSGQPEDVPGKQP
jgi:pyruvyl transferase EpsO